MTTASKPGAAMDFVMFCAREGRQEIDGASFTLLVSPMSGQATSSRLDTLWNACAVVDQLRLLPEEIREALPVAHHRLLLTVRDQEAKVNLAPKAVEENLSKRVFEGEVKRATSSSTPSKAWRP